MLKLSTGDGTGMVRASSGLNADWGEICIPETRVILKRSAMTLSEVGIMRGERMKQRFRSFMMLHIRMLVLPPWK